jgi:transposase InsO family protein
VGNVVADALSCHDTETTADLVAILAPSFAVLDELYHAHATEPALQAVMK